MGHELGPDAGAILIANLSQGLPCWALRPATREDDGKDQTGQRRNSGNDPRDRSLWSCRNPITVLVFECRNDFLFAHAAARHSHNSAAQLIGRAGGAVVKRYAVTERRHDLLRDTCRNIFRILGTGSSGTCQDDQESHRSALHRAAVTGSGRRAGLVCAAITGAPAVRRTDIPNSITAAPAQIHHVSGFTNARIAAVPSGSRAETTT